MGDNQVAKQEAYMAILSRVLKPGLLLACASLVWLGAGCASTPQDTTNMPAPSATVEMHIHSFDPKSVTIQAGQAVLWKNTTFVVGHTVTCDPKLAKDPADVALPAGAEPFNSDTVSSGSTYEHVFTVPGTYRYFCIPHEGNGMVGDVIVQPAAH